MARQDGGGTRRRSPAAALEAGRDHLAGTAGDNDKGGGGESAEDQGPAGSVSGDKPGEFARQPYQLDDMQRTALADALHDDGAGEAGKVSEEAFWRAAADRLGFNPATVEEAADFEDSGAFTAYPAEAAEAAEPAFDPSTNEVDHSAALDRFEKIVAGAEFSLPTLKGDIRDALLDIFRNRHKPWSALSSAEQHDVATALDYAAEVSIRKVVALVAGEGRSPIPATLEKYADKGGEITATIKIVAAGDDTVLALHRASGKAVLIVSADATGYLSQRREAPIERDDPELSFDAGSDEEAGRAPGNNDDLAEAGAAVVDEEALYQRAVATVREHGNASVSWLQRQLEIGWNAASAIVARMEAEGVVSAQDVTTKRTILPFEPAGESGDNGESGGNAKTEAPAAAEAA